MRTIRTEYALVAFDPGGVLTICQGLQDLRNGIIRTPLPPRETFIDDPLRVLRCIRFASRYGFEMVPELEDAARDPEIQVRSYIVTDKIVRSDCL